VVVAATLDPAARALASAAGLIVILIGKTSEGPIPTHEVIRQLERAGILKGMEEQLIEGEGI